MENESQLSSSVLFQFVHGRSMVIAAEEEKRATETFRKWLRPRLRWLMSYPNLLRWYLKLPHKTMIVAISSGPLTPSTFRIVKKSDLKWNIQLEIDNNPQNETATAKIINLASRNS